MVALDWPHSVTLKQQKFDFAPRDLQSGQATSIQNDCLVHCGLIFEIG